jgi:hypothetical protein
MAAFAPPVYRDKFFYSSILYADAGNDNHHPRANVVDLTALLRPEAPKTKKTKVAEVTEPVKDPPWHFWTAQLIHYGLTSTKDKNAAKIRLLSALNGNRLEVPGWIQRLEAEVKKEWDSENKKLRKAAKEGGVSKQGPAKKDTPTRKEAGQSVVEQRSAPASANKPKASVAKRKHDETEAVTQTATSKKAKSTARSDGNPTPKPRAKPTFEQLPASKNALPTEDEPWPAPSRTVIPHNRWKFFDPDYCANTRPMTAPSPGAYRISCPDIEREWSSESIEEFYLAFSTTPGEWWSRFHWGDFKGILVLQRDPKRANKTVGVPFEWRAHYGPGNEDGDGVGQIFFTSTTTFRGQFLNFFRDKPCEFCGQGMSYALRSMQGHSLFTPDQLAGGTPVLDQMRVEWSQMPTAMSDAPAKKPRAKKEKVT